MANEGLTLSSAIQYRQLAEALTRQVKQRGPAQQLPSVRELARQHDVSVFTVSKALKLLEQRGVITRQWGVGCFPSDRQAGRKKPNAAPAIGLVLDPARPPMRSWNTQLIEYTLAAIKAENVTPTYISWRENLTLSSEIDALLVDSDVVYGAGENKALINWLKEVAEGGIAVVTLDCKVPGLSSVQIDNAGGMYQAARYLIQLGHRAIAYQGPSTTGTSGERLAGLRKALQESGITHDDSLVWLIRPSPHATHAQLPSYYRPGKFTAVCCFEDGGAAGIVKAARELNLAVPGDLSVVGYGNMTAGEFARLPLTTLDVRPQELATRAVKLLVEQFQSDQIVLTDLRVQTSLIVRESTGPTSATPTQTRSTRSAT